MRFNYSSPASGGPAPAASGEFTPALTLQGSIHHVALSGNDANSGTTKAEAFLTIQHAVDTAVAGDTVLVHPGTYELTTEIACNKGILIKALHGPSETVLTPTTGTQIRCMYIFETKECIVDGFTFKDGYTVLAGVDEHSGNGGGLCIWQDSGVSPDELGSYAINCQFENCYAQQYGGGAYLMDHKSAVINCVFTGCTTPTGGTAGGGGIGLRWEGYARNCVVVNCNAAYGAVMLHSGLSQVHNCTIVDNTAAGVVMFQGGPHQLYNSIVHDNTGGNIIAISTTTDIKHTSASPKPTGVNNTDAAPVFDNTEDYRLADSSILLGLGMALNWHPSFTDLMGSQRVVGCVDLGASETRSFGLSLANINRYSNSLVTKRMLPTSANPEVTNVLHVDGGRSDTYTADGSILWPFKTITAAVGVATSGFTIKVVPSVTYVEDVTLPANVSLEGVGANYLTIDGDLIVSVGGQASLRFLKVTGAAHAVTINSNCILRDTYFACAVVVGEAATIQSYNTHMIAPADVTALTMNSTGKFHSLNSTISSTGDVPTIHQTAGTLILNTVLVSGFRAGPVILSEGGTVAILNTQTLNTAGGVAINGAANSATGSNPNLLSSVLAIGNVDFAAKDTLADGVQFLVAGSLLGTAITHRAASQIANDSSVPGATVKDALDNVADGGGCVVTVGSSGADFNNFDAAIDALNAIGGGTIVVLTDMLIAGTTKDVSNITFTARLYNLRPTLTKTAATGYWYGSNVKFEYLTVNRIMSPGNEIFRATFDGVKIHSTNLAAMGIAGSPVFMNCDSKVVQIVGQDSAFGFPGQTYSPFSNYSKLSLQLFHGSFLYITGSLQSIRTDASLIDLQGSPTTEPVLLDKASWLLNDSSLTGATAKDALDTLAWLPAMPADGDWKLQVSGGVATWVAA